MLWGCEEEDEECGQPLMRKIQEIVVSGDEAVSVHPDR